MKYKAFRNLVRFHSYRSYWFQCCISRRWIRFFSIFSGKPHLFWAVIKRVSLKCLQKWNMGQLYNHIIQLQSASWKCFQGKFNFRWGLYHFQCHCYQYPHSQVRHSQIKFSLSNLSLHKNSEVEWNSMMEWTTMCFDVENKALG